MNESVVFTDNIFRPLFTHFVGLSSPTHSLFIQKAVFFGKRQIALHYMIRAGSICRELATLLPHGSVILTWSISVSSYMFLWAHNGPDISIYRTGANGVRSCLAAKPISTSWRASLFSFDHFPLCFLCINLPISSLNGDGATFFTVERETAAPTYLVQKIASLLTAINTLSLVSINKSQNQTIFSNFSQP